MMNKKETISIDQGLLKNVSEVLEKARKNANTAVNFSMVYAYYEIGRMIVEEEQHGENRAAYGKKLLKELSIYLTSTFGKGYSAENLKLMRIDNIDERHFYEIESVKNDWSLSELKRQYDSSLYERIDLSTIQIRICIKISVRCRCMSITITAR